MQRAKGKSSRLWLFWGGGAWICGIGMSIAANKQFIEHMLGICLEAPFEGGRHARRAETRLRPPILWAQTPPMPPGLAGNDGVMFFSPGYHPQGFQ